MSRVSDKALVRSSTRERLPVVLLGLLALATGVLGLLVGLGVFGDPRSRRPVLDPIALAVLRAHPVESRLATIAIGLALVVLGILWAVRSLRPEPRPDLYLDSAVRSDDAAPTVVSLRVTSAAATEALAADAESLPGVARARARLVGPESAPALRLTLWLTDGADVRTVWRDVEDGVLSRARSSLGISTLPTAIKLELDPSAGTTRVR